MASTLAQRLGFAPPTGVAIVHADDIGMCHAANVAPSTRSRTASSAAARSWCLSVFRKPPTWRAANPHLGSGCAPDAHSECRTTAGGPSPSRPRAGRCSTSRAFCRAHCWSAARCEARAVEIELRAQIERRSRRGSTSPTSTRNMGTVLLDPSWASTRSSRRSTAAGLRGPIPIPPCWSARASAPSWTYCAGEPSTSRPRVCRSRRRRLFLAQLRSGRGESTPRRGSRASASASPTSSPIRPRDGAELRAISPDAHARRPSSTASTGARRVAIALRGRHPHRRGMRALRRSGAGAS